jgi:hypothetical protein
LFVVHIPGGLQEYGDAWLRMSSARGRFVKSRKQHRYVSRRGPSAQPLHPSIARALDIAENEGWPAASATRIDAPLVAHRTSSARSAPTAFLR